VHRARTGRLGKIIKPFTLKRPYKCAECRWRGWALFSQPFPQASGSREPPSWEPIFRFRAERAPDSRTYAAVLDVAPAATEAKPRTPLPPAVASQLARLAQLLVERRAEGLHSVAIVSCGRGEGASTLTVNLGRCLAARHARTLVVDANSHHPALHGMCGVGPATGLAEVLHGDIPLEAATLPTDTSHLFVLTGGSSDVAPTGVFLQSGLRDRVLRAATGFDFILVDCPAINAYEDAATTAAACDGVVLVVEGGRTQRQGANAAKVLLTRAGCTILGVIMNKRKFHIPQFFYDRL
jgi:capsular exopolysaccharide synthesis family protein